MMNNTLQEAAAAVAANHRMGRRDVMDIIRFALSVMSVMALTVAIL